MTETSVLLLKPSCTVERIRYAQHLETICASFSVGRVAADASCDVAQTHRSTVLLGGVVVRCGEYDVAGMGVIYFRSGDT